MGKIIRMTEADLSRLVKQVIKEQTSQQLAAQQGLDTARAGVRDAKDARRDARQDLRATNRATNQAQQNEINAIYDILKIRRQLGNLPDTIKKAVSQYQEDYQVVF